MRREEVIERLEWHFPELWALTLCFAAWIALIMHSFAHQHHTGALGSWWHWNLMVAAMMLPLKIDGIRLVAERSLWTRRHQAVMGYLLGYLSIWASVGALMAWACAQLDIQHRLDWMTGASIGFLVLTTWMTSPWKANAASACHWTMPLRPTGWNADTDCLCFGWIAGSTCVSNCWPMILLCWLSNHNFLIMCCAFGIGWTERHSGIGLKSNAALAAVLAAIFGVSSFLR